MQAPQNTLCRPAEIVLYKIQVQAGLAKAVAAPGFFKKSAFITEYLRFYYYHI
jgi:hypothetical protein